MCSMESARLKIKEHMTSVGEEILCVLDKQQRGADDCCVELNVRVFVLERLSMAAEFMCNLFQREIETLHNTKLHTADVSSMTVQHMVVEPQKRGRPRKSPVCLPSPALQCVEIQPKKRKPGCSRKHQCGGPVPSPLPEEEREGRDEEREDEMAGEDEERTGRLYDGDPTWHPDHHRERSRVSGEMASKRCSTLPEERRETDQGHGLLDERLKPVVDLGRIDVSSMTVQHMVVEPQKRGRGRPRKYPVCLPSPALQCVVIQPKKRKPGRPRKHQCGDFLHLPVCKEEVVLEQQVRIQEESDPPLSKEEQKELLQRPEDSEDGSIMTLLEEVTGDDDDDDENRETEPVASTSTEHMKTQAVAEDCGTSQPTADDQLSSHCSESDSEAIDEDWEETTEGHLALNTLKSQKTQNVKGQRLSLSKKLSQDPKSSKQTPWMRSPSGKKSYICEVCGKCCGQKANLQHHMRSHTGEKPFSCTVCCKGFSLKSNLQLHMRMHTGEKPFTCTVCGKSCSHSSHLKKHMTMHTETTSYICEICGKGFKLIGCLKSHMKTHTGEKPFSCTVCGKDFSQSNTLRQHMVTHTGEKPYICTVCGNGFSQKGYIKTHMLIHTGEKPFSCTFCAEQFGQKGHLQRHMRRKHTGGNTVSCGLANDVQ